MTRNFFELSRPTYLENWSPELIRFSIPQIGLRLTEDELSAMKKAAFSPVGWNEFSTSAAFKSLYSRLAEIFDEFPTGGFVRLGSRSPKDSILAFKKGLRVKDARQALQILISSARIRQDLTLASQNDYLPYIFVRHWIEIEPWAEFRCFVKNRQMIGISQYVGYNTPAFKEIDENAARFFSVLREKLSTVTDCSNLGYAVFDFVLQTGCNTYFTPYLLEINPFCRLTDACLFDWRKAGDFDGSFRYLKMNERQEKLIAKLDYCKFDIKKGQETTF